MKVSILLSYDLGASGDYDGLYRWLDDRKAKECGSSVALFEYNCGDNKEVGEILLSLKSDLSSAVSINKSTRFYAVCFKKNQIRGKFLIGTRRESPWKGYGSIVEATIDEFGDIL